CFVVVSLMPLYWLVYCHHNQISVVIEPGAVPTAPGIAGVKAVFLLRLWYPTSSKPCRCIAQCLHWLMLPILLGFSATRARTTRAPAGNCRSSESAFRRNCAANLAGRISRYGRTNQSRTASGGKRKSNQLSPGRYFSFRSLRLPLSGAVSGSLNSIHF